MNTFVSNLHIKPAAGKLDTRFTVSSTVLHNGSTDVLPSTWDIGSVPIVLVNVWTNDIVVTFDGSDPSSTNGIKLVAGTVTEWALATYLAARWIRAGASDAAVHASPFCV